MMTTVVLFRFFYILLLVFVTDYIIYLWFKNSLLHNYKAVWKRLVYLLPLYFGAFFIVFATVYLIITYDKNDELATYSSYAKIFTIYFAVYISKFFLCCFVLLNFVVKYYTLRKAKQTSLKEYLTKLKDGHYKFNRTINYLAVIAGVAFFIAAVYGVKVERYNYKTEHHTIYFKTLPECFNNLKIIHLSDLHLGSNDNIEKFAEVIDVINKEKPDLLLMTGDLFNVNETEGERYYQFFKKLNPSIKKYSVLGNHDLGDFRRWYNDERKMTDIKKIVAMENKLGFTVLSDTNQYIKNGKDSIALIGTLNWGLKPYKQIGNIQKAMKGVDERSFKILLTHDADYWDYIYDSLQIRGINLTLSGHTHGLQMGCYTNNIKWTPMSMWKKFTSGLYSKNNEYLFVNSGLGVIGFKGRIGMSPTISVLILKKI